MNFILLIFVGLFLATALQVIVYTALIVLGIVFLPVIVFIFTVFHCLWNKLFSRSKVDSENNQYLYSNEMALK